MRGWFIAAALVALGLLVVLTPILAYHGVRFYDSGYNPDYMKIDDCLDRGGSWNYERRECEDGRQH